MTDDIQALESRHVLQTYRRQPVTFVRGEGVRLFDAEGREYLDLLSGIGVASLGHAHPGLARGDRRSGADAAAHLEPVLSPAAGPAGRAAGAPVGAAARVLLQQRHRSGRSVSEVRAPLLVHARRAADARSSRSRTRFTAARSDRCRSRRTSTIARRSRRCSPASVRAGQRSRGARWPPSRASTAAIIVEPIQGEGGVRPLTPAFAAAINEACDADRRAAHRRRSAVRPRPHRVSVLLRARSGSSRT